MASKTLKMVPKNRKKRTTNSNMKKKYYALACFLLLLLGMGLPQSREMEELQLITALSVDGGEGEISLTALTAVRASDDEPPETLAAQGFDMDSACRGIQEAKASRAYLGQTDKLLLGEGIARSELMEILEFVLDHRELRLDTLLYIVKGNADDGLTASALEAVRETPGRDPRGVSVGQALSQLFEGKQARVPALAPGEDGQLRPAGWAVLDRQGLAGYTGDAARVWAVLEGEADRG